MGSGKKKAHESFTIAPAPEAEDIIHESLPSGGAPGAAVPQGHEGPSSNEGQLEQHLDEALDDAIDSATCAVCEKTFAAPLGTGTKGSICPDCSAVADPETPATPAAGDTDSVPTVEELEAMLDDEPGAVDDPSTAGELDAAHESESWTGDDLLTPIPDQLTVGDGIGTAVAVGGADLLDGAAILTSYKDPKGGLPHEVLRATLTTDAEEKLLDALSPPDAPKVPIQVAEMVSGRLPIDEEHKLHEELAKAAKSVNAHRKDGTAIPQHTLDRIDSVDKKLQQLQGTVAAGSAEAEMLVHYQAGVEQCKQRIAADFNTPYGEGGKIPMINPFEHTGEVMVTKMVPDPTFEGAGLPVTQRPMSRIAPTLNDGGESTWDGKKRADAPGTELAIDLGNGYQAVVRPTTMNPAGQCAASLRGTVEVIAPPGAGHQHELLEQLGSLNIVNRPMNAAEAEWTYLQRNITAHGLGNNTAVAAALQSATDIEEAHAHRLLMQRAPKAIGLDDASLARFARKLQLDAEADALPDKVRLLRDGVGKSLGHADGAAMTKSVSYDPIPQRARGWLTWGRIGQSPTDLKAAFSNRVMTHSISGGHQNLSKVLTSGVLACTERRRMMGVQSGLGMSEHSDTISGGASSIFLRMQPKGTTLGGARLIWNRPEKLLSRTDWYAYDGDHFGAAVAGTGHSVHGQTRDPHKVAQFCGGSNEVMISHGLDLLGADAPDKVVCPASYRPTLLADLAKAGITTIGGRPVEKVVVSG